MERVADMKTQKTIVIGSVLASDYTKQPHLVSMEGVVVSGRLASEVLLS